MRPSRPWPGARPAQFDAGLQRSVLADDGAAARGEVVAWLARGTGRPEPRWTGGGGPAGRRFTADRIIANDRIKRELGWKPAYPTYREGYEAILAAR